MKPDKETLRSYPKVLLHEHLDGVLRPQTVIDLAEDVGYSELPTNDPAALAQWFHRGANQGSLAKYLEGFKHTIAVMQTEEALERVAYEQAGDLSKDGVVYFETRFAPIFHTHKGLTHQQVVAAVLKGLERGRKDFGIASGLIICAMRNMDVSLEMAELAVDFRARGVVGFDLAGEEGGYPPKKHVAAFHYIQRENFNITIHAGEGYGKESNAVPTAAPAGAAGPPAPARRRPLARAAAGSGICLVIAAAAVRAAFIFDPGPPGPTPHHSWAPVMLFLAFMAVLAALGFVGYGVITSVEQRRSRRQLPPRTGPGGHAPDGERRGSTGHGPVPPGPRTGQTRADLRAHTSRQRRRHVPARAGRALRAVRPTPDAA